MISNRAARGRHARCSRTSTRAKRTLAWAATNLVIVGGRGLGLTLLERHETAAVVVARSAPETAERVA